MRKTFAGRNDDDDRKAQRKVLTFDIVMASRVVERFVVVQLCTSQLKCGSLLKPDLSRLVAKAIM